MHQVDSTYLSAPPIQFRHNSNSALRPFSYPLQFTWCPHKRQHSILFLRIQLFVLLDEVAPCYLTFEKGEERNTFTNTIKM